MIKYLSIAGLFLMASCHSTSKTTSSVTSSTTTADPAVYAATITESELKEHLYTYASDEFEGRETGEPGQKMAVDYLRQHYLDLEIPAAQDNGDYFQKVPLEMAKLPKGALQINGTDYTLGEDFITFTPLEGNFNEVVYAGYGIDDPEYSDYTGLDVEGKVVLVKAGEPANEDGTFILTGTDRNSSWGNMSEGPNMRLVAAKAKGVKAILFVDSENFNRYGRYYKRMKSNDRGRLGFEADANNPALILINEAMATAIFTKFNDLKGPLTQETNLVATLESSNEPISTENVVAYIKGAEKPDEYLVISSHLDHIGVSKDGSINNGADDDGSGSVAMLEIAEAFQTAVEAGHRPKRSVVFLHVTGEEKGLLGSRYYTDYNPVFPLEQTVANLNIDMIGRIDPKREGDRNYVYLIGSDKLSSDLHKLSEEINDKYTNITLDYTYNDENDPNRFYYRSDHYNFAKNNIPIIFYFNGTHDDYHRPGDTPDKINYDLLTNRTKLVFHTAWAVANRSERVVVDKDSK
ncbi:M28 family peptidase [Muriicola soli]|uniref:M28 family peptidase n=1 Tax=Muriicola soli TaxID=2507538 RepID=A0A411E8P5_9FLAO|nr:M28 family peptidase [Muriicola soli]QBA63947.1 M28 family peptidase [Muriicola soli]